MSILCPQIYACCTKLLLVPCDSKLSKPQPNPNSTQPQPKVGFDMIIAVHTTPPTTNSTSTRNKGSFGLKFCIRPQTTKLTTTQHNFNPAIGWGVGPASSPLD